jgi:hypothetical protein
MLSFGFVGAPNSYGMPGSDWEASGAGNNGEQPDAPSGRQAESFADDLLGEEPRIARYAAWGTSGGQCVLMFLSDHRYASRSDVCCTLRRPVCRPRQV